MSKIHHKVVKISGPPYCWSRQYFAVSPLKKIIKNFRHFLKLEDADTMLDLTPRSKIFTLDLSSTRNNEPLPVDSQDIEYLPEIPVLSVDYTEVKETVSEAMISLDISPIKYHLKRKYLDEVTVVTGIP